MDLLDPKEKLDLWQAMQELVDSRKKKRSLHLAGVVGLFFCMGIVVLVLGACYHASEAGDERESRFESKASVDAPGLQTGRGGDDAPLIIHL